MCTPSNVVLITDCGASAQPYTKGYHRAGVPILSLVGASLGIQVRYQSKRAGS